MLYKTLCIISTLFALVTVSYVYATTSLPVLVALEAIALCMAAYSFFHTNWYVG